MKAIRYSARIRRDQPQEHIEPQASYASFSQVKGEMVTEKDAPPRIPGPVTKKSAKKENGGWAKTLNSDVVVNSNYANQPIVVQPVTADTIQREPYDNLAISIFIFFFAFGWPLGIILSCIARRANAKHDYPRADCYGKIALYTNLMVTALAIVGYLILLISVGFI